MLGEVFLALALLGVVTQADLIVQLIDGMSVVNTFVPDGCYPTDCVSFVQLARTLSPDVFSFDILLSEDATVWFAETPTRVVTIDNTVDFSLTSPNPDFFDNMPPFAPAKAISFGPPATTLNFTVTLDEMEQTGKYIVNVSIPVTFGQFNGSAIGNFAFTIRVQIIPAHAFSGDPYYKTLDGLRYKYDGPCSYLLLSNDECPENDENENKFSIVTHHGRCRSRRRNVVCIKSLSAIINNKRLEITANNELVIDGVEKEIPYEDDEFKITPRVHELARKKQTYTDYFVETNFGLSFVFSNEGTGTGYVESIPDGMKTCGLLGNKNGNFKDDLLLHDGQILTSESDEELALNIIRMGDDWMVPTFFQPLRCDWYAQESFASTKMCRFRKKYVEQVCDSMVETYSREYRGYNIEKCFLGQDHRQIDATRIYDDCVTEICACGDDDISQCEPIIALGTMKNSCLQNGASRKFPIVSFADIIKSSDEQIDLPIDDDEEDDQDIIPRILQ